MTARHGQGYHPLTTTDQRTGRHAMSKKPLPPPVHTSPSGRFTLWQVIVREARRKPDVWWLALPATPLTRARDVRQRRARDLHHDDGRLEADARNVYIHEGQARCDLYVRWRPNERENR